MYFNVNLAMTHSALFDKAVRQLEVQDDEVYCRDVSYGSEFTMPFAPYPFPVNAAYLQVHSF